MLRVLIVLHRWVGVALCLLFLLWFPSGIGMMYWGFPSVTEADRLARAPALDAGQVTLTPQAAARTLRLDPRRPDRMRLTTVATFRGSTTTAPSGTSSSSLSCWAEPRCA